MRLNKKWRSSRGQEQASIHPLTIAGEIFKFKDKNNKIILRTIEIALIKKAISSCNMLQRIGLGLQQLSKIIFNNHNKDQIQTLLMMKRNWCFSMNLTFSYYIKPH